MAIYIKVYYYNLAEFNSRYFLCGHGTLYQDRVFILKGLYKILSKYLLEYLIK